MLRRWIPILGVAALVTAGELLITETAEGGPLSNRRCRTTRRSYYRGCCATTCCTTSCCQTTCCVPVCCSTSCGQQCCVVTTGRLGRRRVVYVSQPSSSTAMSQPGVYRSFYRVPTESAPALLNLIVPADAKVEINGQQTTSTGTNRSFETPALDPNKDYTFKIKATWNGPNGKVTRTREVSARAGEQLTVDMFVEPTSR
ncbi:MAG: hypothetical protein KatS3mg105_1160 [Gemmatales bacterium]|nr:MAG: hypothetical protein KatS3mg105_1160 [Gemmatales bacterium]